MVRLGSVDGPLSVRGCPSTVKGAPRFISKMTFSHPLTVEPLHPLRSETKGQAGACPDRTRTIPCKVWGQSRGEDRRAISVQLDRVTSGQSRVLWVYEVGWSTASRAMICPIPKLIVRKIAERPGIRPLTSSNSCSLVALGLAPHWP